MLAMIATIAMLAALAAIDTIAIIAGFGRRGPGSGPCGAPPPRQVAPNPGRGATRTSS